MIMHMDDKTHKGSTLPWEPQHPSRHDDIHATTSMRDINIMHTGLFRSDSPLPLPRYLIVL